MDSQSVKGTPESCVESGFDGGQLVQGRKRHILCDTIGGLIVVRVHAANRFDGKAARQVITKLFLGRHTVTKIWADSTYSGPELSAWVLSPFGCLIRGGLENKKLCQVSTSYTRRWVVEGTFAWLIRSRRLNEDYERKPTSSEAQVYLASGRLLLRQICDHRTPYKMAIG